MRWRPAVIGAAVGILIPAIIVTLAQAGACEDEFKRVCDLERLGRRACAERAVELCLKAPDRDGCEWRVMQRCYPYAKRGVPVCEFLATRACTPVVVAP